MADIETPRTDEEEINTEFGFRVEAKFARTLEREAEALRRALELLLVEVVQSGNATAKNHGWPVAVKAACDVLGVRIAPNLEIILEAKP